MASSDEIIVSAISAGKSRLQQAMETYRAAVKQMSAVTGADILAAFQALLDENPLVNAVTWEQYTPYFRDGEECVFELHGRRYGGPSKWARAHLPAPSDFEESCEWRDSERDSDAVIEAPEEWEWIVGRAPTAEEVEAVNSAVDDATPELPGYEAPDPDEEDDYTSNYFGTEYTDSGFGIYTETIRTPNPNSRNEWDRFNCQYVKHEEIEGAADQIEAVCDFVDSIPHQLLERTFGDHTVVFVWRNAIAIRHVDHS